MEKILHQVGCPKTFFTPMCRIFSINRIYIYMHIWKISCTVTVIKCPYIRWMYVYECMWSSTMKIAAVYQPRICWQRSMCCIICQLPVMPHLWGSLLPIEIARIHATSEYPACRDVYIHSCWKSLSITGNTLYTFHYVMGSMMYFSMVQPRTSFF